MGTVVGQKGPPGEQALNDGPELVEILIALAGTA